MTPAQRAEALAALARRRRTVLALEALLVAAVVGVSFVAEVWLSTLAGIVAVSIVVAVVARERRIAATVYSLIDPHAPSADPRRSAPRRRR